MTGRPHLSVRDKVILVTGAARGLGFAFAESLAAEGAKVALADLKAENVLAAAAAISACQGHAIGLACDVVDPVSAEKAVQETVGAFGRIDGLVNNAGVNQVAASEEADLSGWLRVIEVNLVGAYVMSRSVGPAMIANGNGSIVNIASIHAHVAPAFHPASAYATSKAGLLGLTRALAVEWGKHSIRVNALAPGFVRTEMTRGRLDEPDYRARVLERTPLRAIIEPTDLTGAVHYLLSDASRLVTGQSLAVDGGWLAL